MTRSRFYLIGLAVICVAIAGNTALILTNIKRVSNDESRTCMVQSRGLEGQRHLTAIMSDVAVLLSPAPGLHATPTPPQLVQPLSNLREQLGIYLTIEGQQPPTRNC